MSLVGTGVLRGESWFTSQHQSLNDSRHKIEAATQIPVWKGFVHVLNVLEDCIFKYELRGAVLFKRDPVIVNSRACMEKGFSLRIPVSDVLIGFLIFLIQKLWRNITVVVLLIYTCGNMYWLRFFWRLYVQCTLGICFAFLKYPTIFHSLSMVTSLVFLQRKDKNTSDSLPTTFKLLNTKQCMVLECFAWRPVSAASNGEED